MKLRSSNEVRRCRPLLGTFVEIAARGKDRQRLECAIEAGFGAIARVHRLMSFYDPASDVSRMNREAFPKGTIVHPWTWRVLQAAQNFARASDGIFDITAASRPPFRSTASWRDIFLRGKREVFFRRKVIVDLGGIAKGFAVDRAIDALQRAGLTNGMVNAGGDIRMFGSASRQVHLRHPAAPTRSCGMLRVRNRALATSANYFTRGALRHGRTGLPITRNISVTIAADDCMTADALTKIVLNMREKAAPLLAHHRAEALLLDREDARWSMFRPACDIHVPIP